jgi:hypothetical protein
MPPLRLAAAAVLLLVLPAQGPAHATPLVPSSSERSVFAEAAAEDGPRTSSQSNGDGAEAFEPLDTSVAAAAPADDAGASASSSQTSSLADDRFDGSGMASAAASSTAADGLAFSAADSFFLVVFESTASVPVVLQGLLSATGAGDLFARFELEEELSGVPLFSFEALPGQSVPLSGMADLVAGTSYRLLAIASAAQDVLGIGGPSDGSAAFQFSLVVVPEPSSLLLVGLAAALLARARRA